MDTSAPAPQKIPRPCNAWVLFRRDHQKAVREELTAKGDSTTQASISRLLSQMWRGLPPAEKAKYEYRAEVERAEHRKLHPDYKFCPKTQREKDAERQKKAEKQKAKEGKKRQKGASTPWNEEFTVGAPLEPRGRVSYEAASLHAQAQAKYEAALALLPIVLSLPASSESEEPTTDASAPSLYKADNHANQTILSPERDDFIQPTPPNYITDRQITTMEPFSAFGGLSTSYYLQRASSEQASALQTSDITGEQVHFCALDPSLCDPAFPKSTPLDPSVLDPALFTPNAVEAGPSCDRQTVTASVRSELPLSQEPETLEFRGSQPLPTNDLEAYAFLEKFLNNLNSESFLSGPSAPHLPALQPSTQAPPSAETVFTDSTAPPAPTPSYDETLNSRIEVCCGYGRPVKTRRATRARQNGKYVPYSKSKPKRTKSPTPDPQGSQTQDPVASQSDGAELLDPPFLVDLPDRSLGSALSYWRMDSPPLPQLDTFNLSLSTPFSDDSDVLSSLDVILALDKPLDKQLDNQAERHAPVSDARVNLTADQSLLSWDGFDLFFDEFINAEMTV
ncbi:hypothetical protein NM688_g3565 [Phlebia brevispora]|uniref:Uncharacterized protein n=1 Tax=Phlebia brevispora TaxID=194682 RepID=A0ACC1T5S8_9APHY|nr:hypothetical protein NM688_g3565 [Phlebia brevispora]